MAVPEDTGYPLKWFTQQEFVQSMFECAVCLEVVKGPVQVRYCGHQFCRYCLDGVLRSQPQPRCPSCQKDISEELVFTDNAAKRAIDNLNVNCPSVGCEWNGQLSSYLKEHVEICPFRILSCSNMGCNVQVMTCKDLEVHLAECEHRIVLCQYCNDEHVFKDKAEHLDTCPYLPVECTNKCSEKDIPRNQMREHLEKVCLKTVVKCKYLNFGCKYECERREMEEHLNQEMKDHLELSTLEISRLKDQHQKDIDKLRQETAVLLFIMGFVVYVALQMLPFSAKLHVSQRSAVIITDFNRKLYIAKYSNTLGSIDGDPILISLLGYKIKMTVDLRDKREAYNKDHMGVYMCLMKTDHDAMLSWPFKKKCTFTLIDQQDNEQERKNIVMTMTPDGNDNFKRPKDEENLALGFPDFISHVTLKTRKYIKDDTVFITLDIEP